MPDFLVLIQEDIFNGVANNAQTELLRKAVACLGSTQALASELRVPEGTLQRWVHGRAMMPERAFKKVIDIVAQHVKQAD